MVDLLQQQPLVEFHVGKHSTQHSDDDPTNANLESKTILTNDPTTQHPTRRAMTPRKRQLQIENHPDKWGGDHSRMDNVFDVMKRTVLHGRESRDMVMTK